MGEILDFPTSKRYRDTTATGRFLLAVDQQRQESALKTAQTPVEKSKPTPEESAAAKAELDSIFSGPNKKIAEKLYYQGLNDIVHDRRVGINHEARFQEFYELAELIGVKIYGFTGVKELSNQRTPEGCFIYI